MNNSPSLDSLQGEKLGAYPTAIALTRKIKGKDKKQRIIVLGMQTVSAMPNYKKAQDRVSIHSTSI